MHELGWIMIWFRFGSLICAAPLRAPKWYKRKAGVSFGFGGKLVSFHSSDGSAGSSEVGVPGVVLLWSVLRDLIVSFPAVQVFVHNLVTEHNLLSSSSEFDAAMQSGERSLLRLLCDKKSQESEYVFFSMKDFPWVYGSIWTGSYYIQIQFDWEYTESDPTCESDEYKIY